MKSSYFVLILFALLSCTEHGQSQYYASSSSFSDDSFTESVSLTAKTLEMDNMVMSPSNIQVFDTLLITIDRNAEFLFHVYNLNNNTEINQCIRKGEGPDDMLRPTFIDNDRKIVKIADASRQNVYEFELQEFAYSKTPMPLKTYKLEKPVIGFLADMGDKTYSYASSSECLVEVFDSAGKIEKQLIDFPESNLGMNRNESLSAYYLNLTTNQKDRIALTYSLTDLIEIYDNEGKLQKRLHGPMGFACKMQEKSVDENIMMELAEGFEERDAYFCPRNTGDGFIVSFNGMLVDADDHNSYQNVLYYFDWNGNPIARYTLDDGIFKFDVDPVRRKIYGISSDPEYHLVEYSY